MPLETTTAGNVHLCKSRCYGESPVDFTHQGRYRMLWHHLQKRLLKTGARDLKGQGLLAHSPGIPSDIPPLPSERDLPDIVLPPQIPPRKPPEKLPPRVPPRPRPEPP